MVCTQPEPSSNLGISTGEFESRTLHHAALAQEAERRFETPEARGSNPRGSTTDRCEGTRYFGNQLVRLQHTLSRRGSRSAPTWLAQRESTCFTRRGPRFDSSAGYEERCADLAYFEFDSRRAHTRARSPWGQPARSSRSRSSSRDRSIDGDAAGSYPAEQGSTPCGPTRWSRYGSPALVGRGQAASAARGGSPRFGAYGQATGEPWLNGCHRDPGRR